MKDEVVKFRTTKASKDKLKAIAKRKGITLTDVIEKLLHDLPIPDINRFTAIHNLTKEINYIGNNINQITIAIRQMNADKKLPDGEFERLMESIQSFVEMRRQMADLLRQAIGFRK